MKNDVPLSPALPLSSPRLAQRRLREAALSSFCDPQSPISYMLLELPNQQWRALLTWLDISGLALYLYDRLVELNRAQYLPEQVQARLRQNLADNTIRTRRMLEESLETQQVFQQRGVDYLLLKGFSLAPLSVPRPELRSQLDLDFLVTAETLAVAQRILEERGYVLHGVHGRSWEFKTRSSHSGSLRDLYKDHPARSIELHVEAARDEAGSRVADAIWRDICGFRTPVLAPIPLFLGQAAHLYKHLSTGFFRCSHVLELYRHILARRQEGAFWTGVQKEAVKNRQLTLPLGVTTLLLTQVFGNFAPGALWGYAEELSVPVRTWTEKIGPRCIYASWPGTKLHLLLQRELAAGDLVKQAALGHALLPRRLPPPILTAPASESSVERLQRVRREFAYLLFRLRYHIVAGVQYLWELQRWRRLIERIDSQQNVPVAHARRDHAATSTSEINKKVTIL